MSRCGRYIIGAYEAKTTTFMKKGTMAVWGQAVVEALALNHMADRCKGRYFIPVFGGDFNQHLVVHAAPIQGQDFILHAAQQPEPGKREVAVRYMRYLLQQCKDAAEAGLQGDVRLQTLVQ